jgi:hypothetical protein
VRTRTNLIETAHLLHALALALTEAAFLLALAAAAFQRLLR